MLVTVAICTWNRAALLERTLEELTRVRVPADVSWELLVVNNNCSDHTDEVIAAFADRLPLRRLFEPTPGQTRARITATSAARGSYLVWTDDDVLVEPDWLAAYVRAFRQWPTAAVFGGTVSPWFDGEPPAWLTATFPSIANAYAAANHGDVPLPLEAPDRLPVGANMALRLDVQRRFPFDPELGLRPGRALRGDEVDVVARVLAAGEHGWWVPDARVRHFIPHQRQSLEYLRGYFRAMGEYRARTEPDLAAPRLLGGPRWMWRHALANELRFRVHYLRGTEARLWMEPFRQAAMTWGYLATVRRGAS